MMARPGRPRRTRADTAPDSAAVPPADVMPASLAEPVAPLTATMAFKGTVALISLSRAAELAAVSFDGRALPPDTWRATAEGTLRVECPPQAFDTHAHALRLDWADAKSGPALTLDLRSCYRFALDRLDDTAITGWIYDELRPASALTLEVAGESWPAFALDNTGAHPALAATPGVIGGGFEIALPPRPAHARAELVRVTVQGTPFEPFGPILRGAMLPATVMAAAGAARLLGRSAAGLLASRVLLPAVVQALGGFTQGAASLLAAEPSRRLRGSQGRTRPALPGVDVIVPAYRGMSETLACLDSLLASGDTVAHRIVVIDDCSPEPELTAALQALAAAGRVSYLRNAANLGFVGSANRGLALSADADVLLLNADTVVAPGFLDRLYRAAYSDPAIATATPLSNNATICSLPLPPGTDGEPYGLDVATLDALCRGANAGVVRDIPTAHGFCMFIKRAALDDVGLFDAARFGAGYGEENDFSLRAFERGWRNVCAADVYVQHLGAVSFAGGREAQIAANLHKVEALYPYYHHFVADFLRTDPLHDVRNRAQVAAWRRIGRIVLVVSLALEGGAVRHVDDLMRRLTGEGCLALALCMGRDMEQRPMLTIRRWNSADVLRYPQPAPVTEALADILDLAPQFIHVQHMLDLPDGIAAFVHDCGIPYVVTLHDYFYACPRVTLLDAGGNYCGMPPVARCAACLRQGPIHPHIHPSLADAAADGVTWRGKWDSLLRDALQVIAPSRDTAARYRALFPGLDCEVRPHFGAPHLALPNPHSHTGQKPRPARGKGLRVAVPGAIGPQKGARQLLELAHHCSRWDDDMVFVVIGHTDRDAQLRRLDNIELSGRYPAGEAVTTLAESGCRVALFLSVFPETFSYTLSEALEAGMVPVAYDFGAIGERLRDLGCGLLIPPGSPPDHLAAAIRLAASVAVAVPPERFYGQYDRLLADYYAPSVTDLAESMPPPDMPRLLAWPAGLHADRWCGAEIRLQVWAPRPIARLMLSFWVPETVGFQYVEFIWRDTVLVREPLDTARVRRVSCTIPARDVRFLDVTCRFDFIYPLLPPDQRACAAMFAGIEVSDGGGWLAVELPAAAS